MKKHNLKSHICEKIIKFDKKNLKVRDHCHLTGRFRGAAHSNCNISYNYKNFKLPIIFHNLKGYDSHFILQYVGQFKDKSISVIPNTMEKYLSFTIDRCIFLDTAQFLNASLESLVNGLNKAKNEELFKHFNSGFENSSSELKLLLRQKGIFPYDFYDCKEKLTFKTLPEQKYFYNKLNESDVTDEDYKLATSVFDLAGCQNFGDYLSLYLKCDVLLLADVFEEFRNMCQKYYKLEACHFITSPGFSWNAMLKMTDAKIECFKEGQEDMLDMIEQNIRGGISTITNRYAKANNKYMKNFDSSLASSFIMYLDANILYGGAMSEYLPTGNYKWKNMSLVDILNLLCFC